jgi:surface polysaccharide O-acyltransferase-like enzyme
MNSARIISLDRSRTSITLLVVIYHSVLNYTYYGVGGDQVRWLGFDGVALFCDSLMRRGSVGYIKNRMLRLGVPYLISIFVIMPIAYYRYYHTQLDFLQFYDRMISVGPWSPGSAWFILVLLVFDLVAVPCLPAIRMLGRHVNALSDDPIKFFVTCAVFSVAIYLPMRLIFGDSAWLTSGHYPFVMQTSRILLYSGYFLAGAVVGATDLTKGLLAQDRAIARWWRQWLAIASISFSGILFLVYVHRDGLIDFASPPFWWHAAYGLCFAIYGAAMTFVVLSIFTRFAGSRMALLDAMRPSAYGIYLLHFIPLVWLQYLLLDLTLPAFAKFLIVFTVTLSVSWGMTVLLRQIPIVSRIV